MTRSALGRPVGAHVSPSGGIERAVARAEERKADALQVFSSNPRAWALPALHADAETSGARSLAQRGFPLFLHAPYLVNLASPDPVTWRRSLSSVTFALERGARLGAAGVVVHAGHAAGDAAEEALARAADALGQLLAANGDVDLVVELTAGGRGAVAARPDEAAHLLAAAGGHPRLRVCLDTCHLWAAGVDYASENGLEQLAAGIRSLGPERVALVHVNDSADPPRSRCDRHRNLGQGTIPLAALGRFLTLPELGEAPLVVETPGPASAQAADVATVRRLIATG